MKKIAICLVLMLSLLAGCSGQEPDLPQNSGGSEEPEASRLENIDFQGDELYAAAYLGYQQIDDLEYYVQLYLDSDELPTHYVSGGDFYLLIPRHQGTALRLYINDVETDERTLVFEDPSCEPLIIQCNASDIFTDITAELTYDGETAVFSPFISLRDGTLELGERGLDITRDDAPAA